MENKSNNLRTAGIIQIIVGIISIFADHAIIGAADASSIGMDGKSALHLLIVAYTGAAFQIIAGIVGVVSAHKKSVLTVLFGILLFIPQIGNVIMAKGSTVTLIISILFLLIPLFYLVSALKNFKNA